MFVHNGLVDDIRHHRFGAGLDLTHKSSHLGISVLAVAPRSASDQRIINEHDSALSEATQKTTKDILEARSKPPPIPKDEVAMGQLLRVYTCLLTNLFGKKCPHRREVKDISAAWDNLSRRHPGGIQ